MIPSLVLIVVLLVVVIIFLGIRASAYKKAYLFYAEAIKNICDAGNTYDEALAVMASVYHLEESEVIRRLQSESQASSS